MDELVSGVNYKDQGFPKKFTKIIYLANSDLSWDVNGDIVFRLYNDTCLVSQNTIRINYWYELKQEKYQYLFYNAINIVVPNESFKSLFSEDLKERVICYNEEITLPEYISQFYISDNIKHVEKQFSNKLKLININEKYDIEKPCYFFGIYNDNDLKKIETHKGERHVIFGGSDLDENMFHFKVLLPKILKLKDIKFYFISENLLNRGIKYKIYGSLVKLDLTDDSYDNKICEVSELLKRKNIYCYTGCNKLGKLYNYELILEIEKRLPEYNFIYSHKLNLEPREMKDIYNTCFIGIRLTRKDGNANTVIEMGRLGIPVIFNGNSVNGISYIYDSVDDIVKKIISVKDFELS